MADECKRYDVAIVGSGVAGALIAKYLAARGKKVVILEAGAKIPPNINDYMERFFTSTFKVPESPYTPALFSPEDSTLLSKLADPGTVNAGRPTVLSLSPDKWKDPKKSYLVQGQKDGDQPFASTYERVAGGTCYPLARHLSAILRQRLQDEEQLRPVRGLAHRLQRLGSLVRPSGTRARRGGGRARPGRPRHSLRRRLRLSNAENPALARRRGGRRCAGEVHRGRARGVGNGRPKKPIRVISTPAARNSQPYGDRRACAGNTNCIPICPIQAKYDPTITLNEALDTGNVEFLDHAVASEVVVGPNGRVSQINYIRYEKDFKAPGQTTTTGCVTRHGLRDRRQLHRDAAPLADVEDRRPRGRGRQQFGIGRQEPDGPPVLRGLGR